MKNCRGDCGRELPLNAFYRKYDGRTARCRECVLNDARAKRKVDTRIREREKIREKRNQEGRRASRRRYHARNREQLNRQSENWVEQNTEHCRDYQRSYYQRNRESIRARAETWRLANPARSREYRRLAAIRRRARLRDLPAERFTVMDVWTRDATDGVATCYLCNAKVTITEAHIEHLIPIAARKNDLEYRGIQNPGSVLANVSLTHGSCNQAKGAALDPRALERYQLNLRAVST